MTSSFKTPWSEARLALLISLWASCTRFQPASAAYFVVPLKPTKSPSAVFAKRANKNRNDSDDLNRWYDSVDDDATPNAVFWEEMDRQRLFNQVQSSSSSSDPAAVAASSSASAMPMSNGVNTMMGGASMMGGINAGTPDIPMSSTPKPTMEQQKAAESTLVEYAMYQVADNWLDEDLQMQMEQMKSSLLLEDDPGELTLEEETQRLEEQLEALPDGFGEGSLSGLSLMDDEHDEPWDHYGRREEEEEDLERSDVRKVSEPPPVDPEERQREEANFWKRMENCQTSSRRLKRAKMSPEAKKFFQRPPDQREGYEQMWVSAIDNACFKSLIGNFRNYGVQFADNFGDWDDGCAEDALHFSIEDLAAYKARKVFQATGLPCIASRTSFEIEPVPPAAATGISNPRVLSGYKVNDIANHVDYLCEALQPMSEPDRVTRFTSCLCFYDGEMEIFDYGVCEVDLHYCNSMRTFIPMAQAINFMIETLQLTFGMEYMPFLRTRVEHALSGSLGKASLKLRDRVLKDGKVLPNNIIDVSEFMDSQIDVNLMDECAKELSNRFMQQKPTKIMTVATTGLVIALPMAKYLQVPVVYARKERNIVMADTYQAGYSSKTVGKNRELLVSKLHVHEDDRILVVDDFLSSGASQEALLRIISDAGATAVGVGVLLEKVYDSGRQSLSGFNIPIQSLCRVASVQGGVIQLVEEEGFDKMKED